MTVRELDDFIAEYYSGLEDWYDYDVIEHEPGEAIVVKSPFSDRRFVLYLCSNGERSWVDFDLDLP